MQAPCPREGAATLAMPIDDDTTTLTKYCAERKQQIKITDKLITVSAAVSTINMNAAHTAVVTGATGFVATELVKQLLEKGYNVRATVRSTADEYKTAFLTSLGAVFPGKLQLCEADLMVPGSFDGAISGATYVFHVASPFRIDVEDAQRDLIEPAVHGTRNVLSSVAKHKDTIKRTVITSSVAGTPMCCVV